MRPFARAINPAIIFLFCLALAVSACGRKGKPTLRSFDKPAGVSDISVLHREETVLVSWSYPAAGREDLAGFYVEKAEGENGEFRKLALIKSGPLTFTDPSCRPGTKCRYRVIPLSLRNVSADPSPVISANPLQPPPPTTDLHPVIGSDALSIKWSAVFNADDRTSPVLYNIYKSTKKGVIPDAPFNREPLKEPFFEDRIDTARTVYYTVRSLLGTEIKDEGAPSRELEISPSLFVPAIPSAVQAVWTETGPYLSWEGSPEEWTRGYRVYRRLPGESEFSAVGDASVPSFRDRRALGGKVYYRITAMGPEKESGQSETIEVSRPEER